MLCKYFLSLYKALFNKPNLSKKEFKKLNVKQIRSRLNKARKICFLIIMYLILLSKVQFAFLDQIITIGKTITGSHHTHTISLTEGILKSLHQILKTQINELKQLVEISNYFKDKQEGTSSINQFSLPTNTHQNNQRNLLPHPPSDLHEKINKLNEKGKHSLSLSLQSNMVHNQSNIHGLIHNVHAILKDKQKTVSQNQTVINSVFNKKTKSDVVIPVKLFWSH